MSDITQKKVEELQSSIAEKREALRAFRFGGAGSRARNVREGREIRKEIARMLTELRARTIASSTK